MATCFDRLIDATEVIADLNTIAKSKAKRKHVATGKPRGRVPSSRAKRIRLRQYQEELELLLSADELLPPELQTRADRLGAALANRTHRVSSGEVYHEPCEVLDLEVSRAYANRREPSTNDECHFTYARCENPNMLTYASMTQWLANEPDHCELAESTLPDWVSVGKDRIPGIRCYRAPALAPRPTNAHLRESNSPEFPPLPSFVDSRPLPPLTIPRCNGELTALEGEFFPTTTPIGEVVETVSLRAIVARFKSGQITAKRARELYALAKRPDTVRVQFTSELRRNDRMNGRPFYGPVMVKSAE